MGSLCNNIMKFGDDGLFGFRILLCCFFGKFLLICVCFFLYMCMEYGIFLDVGDKKKG